MDIRCEEIMDVKELKAKIVSKQIPNFLVFTGDEWEVQKIYIQQISSVTNLSMKYIDSATEITGKLKANSLVGKQNNLYIVRDDKVLTTDEKVLAKVKDNIGQNILILLLTKLDKRLKFYNANKDTIIVFEPLKPEILEKYIAKEINLSKKNIQKLIEVCDGNYGRIRLEIDKIKCFAHGTKEDNRDLHASKPEDFIDYCFRVLLEDGTIYREPKDAIFDFVNAVLDRKVNKAYELYQDCQAINESTLAILINLFNNAKAILQVQTCTSKDVTKTTGLTGWQIMNARQHVDVYLKEELEYMIQLIQYCEQAIKTGQMEEQFVIDYILVRIL